MDEMIEGNFALLGPDEQARLLRDLAMHAYNRAMQDTQALHRYAELALAASHLSYRIDPAGAMGQARPLPEDRRRLAALLVAVSTWARERQRQPDHGMREEEAPMLRILEARAAELASHLDPERQQQQERSRR